MSSEILITLLLGLLDRAAAVSALFQTTRSENREPSSEELAALDAEFTTARRALVEAIRLARAQGR